MKIAILSIYSGIVRRGAESFVDEFATELFRKKYSVVVFQNEQLGKDSTYKIEKINVFHSWPRDMTSTWQRKLFIDFYSLKILQFTLKAAVDIWKNKYEIVIPTNGFWQTLICRIVTLLYGGKLVITGHSGPGWDEKWNLYFKPDVFVATTPSAFDWAKRTCSYTPVKLIPYGINLTKYETAEPTPLTLEKPIILCSAAAVPYKRVDLAIKAVAKAKKGSLLHLGGGDLKRELTSLGSKLLGPQRFLSLEVNNSEMPGYYKACDIVTLPSTSQENSPMTFLEAMAAGKIVVATDAPRPRWMLGPAGIFVDPENTVQYARAIENGLKIKDKSLVKKQAEKYSWEKIVSQYEKLFNSL